MSNFIFSIWELFLSSLAPLISLALGISLAGWLLVLCRVSLRLRIMASAFALSLLTFGSGLVMIAPLMAVRTASVPWVTEVFAVAREASEEVVWQPSLPKVVSRLNVKHTTDSVSVSTRDLLGIAWILGTVVSLGWLLRDGWKLRRHLRTLRPLNTTLTSLPRGTILCADTGANSPYSCGLWRHVLVLPEPWLREETESLRLALDHERAHLRHRDAITQLVWRLGKALWWWNPMIHVLASRVDELLEWRADAEATRGDVEQAVKLSHTLIELVSPAATPRLVHAMAASTTKLLQRRLEQMLGNESQSVLSRWLHRCAAGVLLVGALAMMIGCSLPVVGAKHEEPFPNGEIIETTPDHWQEAKKKLPIYTTPAPKGALSDDSARMGHASTDVELSAKKSPSPEEAFEQQVAQMEQSLQRLGKRSQTLLAVDVRIIESDASLAADLPVTGGWNTQFLSADELSSALRSLITDPRTKVVSYPRMVTMNGHPVMIRSVVNQPVHLKPSNDEITYLPIGTIMLFGLIQRPDGRLHLESDITVSKIIGSTRIAGNDYPIASSMVYRSAYGLDSGVDLQPGGSLVIAAPKTTQRKITIIVTPSILQPDDKNPFGIDLVPSGK